MLFIWITFAPYKITFVLHGQLWNYVERVRRYTACSIPKNQEQTQKFPTTGATNSHISFIDGPYLDRRYVGLGKTVKRHTHDKPSPPP